MIQKGVVLLSVMILSLLSIGIVAGQDATSTPLPPAEENVEYQTPLENLTADPASYYGQELTLEGIVEELVNVRTFVLGEGAALDDDRVLVINNSGQEFGLNITRDQKVRLTGVIYPSIQEGGVEQFVSASMLPATAEATATDELMTPEATATEEMTVDEFVTTPEATDDVMPTAEPTVDDCASGIVLPGCAPFVDFTLMALPDEYNNYTIVVLNSLDSVTYIEQK